MKVLHINCNYLGTTLHQTMIEHLNALNIHNSVFVPIHERMEYTIQPASYVKVSKCFRKWDRVIFHNKNRKIYNSVRREFGIDQFDLVHAYTLFTDGYVAYKIKQAYNKPYVVAIRNTDVNDFFKHMVHLRKLGVRIMQEASAIFFLSPTYKKHVFDNYVPNGLKNTLEQKCYIIPNGIDDYWLDNSYHSVKTIDKDKIKIVFAGKLDKNKNLELILKAMDLLKKDGYIIHLTAVGKIVDERIHRIIEKRNDTTYISSKPKEELIKIYRNNDIFVMPSHKESFGLVYAEAMSQGLPVIYTKGQGFDAQFDDGVVGYSVVSSDVKDLYNRLILIIKNYCRIQRNTVSCANSFRWDKIVQKYSKVYKSIVG